MKILITGANGYIGQRLIPVLIEQGHQLHCCVRNRKRFEAEHTHPQILIEEVDFLQPVDDQVFPKNVDVAFYLIHSMSSKGDFMEKEAMAARNFTRALEKTSCRQVIYLSGIVNEAELSDHLNSRFNVEKILRSGTVPLTVLRAGIIVGSGSASFEIIRELIEKLPVLIGPKWLKTRCQPIGVRNVVRFLEGVMLREETFGKDYDIGGSEVLSYREMLMQYAQVRQLRRYIFILPLISPRLSSHWLYFITSTSFPLAVNLVDSMKVNVICRPNSLAEDLGIELMTYRDAVKLAFLRIRQHTVISSWKDAFVSFDTNPRLMEYVEVPDFGCFRDIKKRDVTGREDAVQERIWSIGGQTGWYYATLLWKFRGYLDRFMGGVGLRRGRTNPDKIYAGDALDFWRVLVADLPNRRLLLFAEMILPGEAWLEFKIVKRLERRELRQTATFRPKGIWGRLYWYSLLPFHFFIFNGMINKLVQPKMGEQ
ncbi:MAG: SDR family oxidoreductase [Bacteroidetes bacterium]|nr:SDR family oxidoreductase [Bacteroidota bacterium]